MCSGLLAKKLDGLSFTELQQLEHMLKEGALCIKDHMVYINKYIYIYSFFQLFVTLWYRDFEVFILKSIVYITSFYVRFFP